MNRLDMYHECDRQTEPSSAIAF